MTNIVPSCCDVDFEIRYVASDYPEAIIKALAARGRSIAAGYRAVLAEAGMFASTLGCPAVVCVPGSMERGHNADVCVERSQMEECDSMLGRLLARLESGL